MFNYSLPDAQVYDQESQLFQVIEFETYTVPTPNPPSL